MQCEAPVSVATIEQEGLRLKQLSFRDIVRCYVQSLSRRRHPNEKGRAELGDERKVDLLAGWWLEAAECRLIQRDHSHAITVIQIALDDDPKGIVAVVVLDRKNDYAWLGARGVAETQPYTRSCGRVLRAE